MKIVAAAFSFLVASSLLGLLGIHQHQENPPVYQSALAEAKAEHRNVLLEFTGSDWCPVCIEMEKGTLNTRAFKDYAAKKLVVLKVDFPVSKPLEKKLQDQNDLLQKMFHADDLPNYVLVNSDGKELGRQEGILEGGPAALISKLDSFQK